MILITGSNGQLGTELCHLLDERNISYTATDAVEMDITDKDAVDAVFQAVKPTFVFHCAAYTAVDKAEDEGKDQQASQIEPLGGEVAVCAAQGGNTAKHHDNGQVGEDKEKDTLHGQPFACSVCGCDGVSCLWWWRQGFLQVPHVPQV